MFPLIMKKRIKARKPAPLSPGDIVETENGLDRGLVVKTDKRGRPLAIMGRPSTIDKVHPVRYYGAIDKKEWFRTGERMSVDEWLEQYL